ncbi:MAG: MotA/TolQ/ExbB proton channel family protein [Sneathiellales bacterium]|nr:MotA/TolQ/ExbB proton channel family protein [Sneathiellales bacterium]
MLLEDFHKLGPMGWPLVLCSILAMMVCLERLIFVLRLRLTLGRHLQALTKIAKDYSLNSKALRDEAITLGLETLKAKAMSGIRFLRLIATLSPLIGLLGTIFGIVTAFQIIAAQTGPVSPNLIADGLWAALLTTAFGLLIALPTLFAAYIFQHLSDRFLGQLVNSLNALSLEMEKENEARLASSSAPFPARGKVA